MDSNDEPPELTDIPHSQYVRYNGIPVVWEKAPASVPSRQAPEDNPEENRFLRHKPWGIAINSEP